MEEPCPEFCETVVQDFEIWIVKIVYAQCYGNLVQDLSCKSVQEFVKLLSSIFCEPCLKFYQNPIIHENLVQGFHDINPSTVNKYPNHDNFLVFRYFCTIFSSFQKTLLVLESVLIIGYLDLEIFQNSLWDWCVA